MKTLFHLRYFVFISLLAMGCSSGKNALQKGNYDESLIKAVQRLRNAPQNKEALQVLAQAYELSVSSHMRNIDAATNSLDPFKWERVIASYQKLNSLSDELFSCSSCVTSLGQVKRYNEQLKDAQLNAAQARLMRGQELMAQNTKGAARDAYTHFEKALYYQPNLRAAREGLNEAHELALVRIVIEHAQIQSSRYQLSNAYFQEQLANWVLNYNGNKFVRFYTQAEASQVKLVPDQVLNMQFLDFVVGQTYVKEKVEKVERDSVKIGETRADGPIYGKVSATLNTFTKQVSSTGLLELKIIDWNSGKVLRSKRLSGTFVWEDQWANYKGDDRALSKKQWQLVKRKEMRPPAPADLFVEFTKPLYTQLVQEISRYYQRI
ncbi:MAG: hypothetical protein EOO99_07535 [Pedobacter sp.]|nr:MAG: hypothetical protein EOO99_07535 [Pedobacter sp.]